jgi:hypothetical protein
MALCSRPGRVSLEGIHIVNCPYFGGVRSEDTVKTGEQKLVNLLDLSGMLR